MPFAGTGKARVQVDTVEGSGTAAASPQRAMSKHKPMLRLYSGEWKFADADGARRQVVRARPAVALGDLRRDAGDRHESRDERRGG